MWTSQSRQRRLSHIVSMACALAFLACGATQTVVGGVSGTPSTTTRSKTVVNAAPTGSTIHSPQFPVVTQPPSPKPLTGYLSVVSQPISATNSEIDVFAEGVDQHLYDDYWDGTHWQWLKLGAPANTTLASSPGAAFYQFKGVTKVYAFVFASDGHLYVNYGAGTQRTWADQGAAPVPGGDKPEQLGQYPPAVIAFPVNGFTRLYAFVTEDPNIWANYWDGTKWSWTNLGQYTCSAGCISDGINAAPGAGYYKGSVYVFAQLGGWPPAVYQANGGEVYELGTLYRTNGWNWADQGRPALDIDQYPPAVATEMLYGFLGLYVFVRTKSGQLAVNFWDGQSWHWANQGGPPGGQMASGPGVTTFTGNLYAFVANSNGHLAVNYWTGTQWKWADQGTPLDGYVKSAPGVVTANYNGVAYLYAFVVDSNGNLAVNYTNGAQWLWSDMGVAQ